MMTRRSLLRRAGGALATVGLPPLEALLNTNGTALADGSPLPKRFGIFFWGNGVLPKRFVPTAEGSGWALTDQLQPLEGVKANIAVLTNMPNRVMGNCHHRGVAGMMCGAPAMPSTSVGATMPLPTVDMIAARAIGAAAPLRSLEIGIGKPSHPHEGTMSYAISHSGPAAVNRPELSPLALFNRIFGLAAGTGAAPEDQTLVKLRAAGRQRVLDAAMVDAQALRSVVGKSDQRRLDEHLSGIADLRKKILSFTAAPVAACTPPSQPVDGAFSYLRRNELMTELLAHALLCDKTRVFSYMFNIWHTEKFGTDIPGAADEFHGYTHTEPGEQPMVHAHVMVVMRCLGTLLGRLQQIRVGSGTLLDQCAILCTSDHGLGQKHSADVPLIVAGRAGGALKTGFHHRSATAENPSMVHLALLRAVGAQVAEFGGGSGRATEPLAALLG